MAHQTSLQMVSRGLREQSQTPQPGIPNNSPPGCKLPLLLPPLFLLSVSVRPAHSWPQALICAPSLVTLPVSIMSSWPGGLPQDCPTRQWPPLLWLLQNSFTGKSLLGGESFENQAELDSNLACCLFDIGQVKSSLYGSTRLICKTGMEWLPL